MGVCKNSTVLSLGKHLSLSLIFSTMMLFKNLVKRRMGVDSGISRDKLSGSRLERFVSSEIWPHILLIFPLKHVVHFKAFDELFSASQEPIKPQISFFQTSWEKITLTFTNNINLLWRTCCLCRHIIIVSELWISLMLNTVKWEILLSGFYFM